MLIKIFSVFISISFILCLCSCTLTESGTSLYAFCERMNERHDSYELSPSGYIADENNCTLTKFFKFAEKEIMLQFEYGKKNELTALHIVFDGLDENNTYEWNFIKNCISSFINDDTLTADLLAQIQFDDTIFIKDINSKKEKTGNTEISIDVTETGTVISVYQNIL